jgi:hypothetical protein
MTCPKCRGLLVAEPSMDFYVRADLWKCVNCGAAPTITLLQPRDGQKLTALRHGKCTRAGSIGPRHVRLPHHQRST